MFFYSPEGAESMTSLDAERLAHGVTNTIAALTPRLNDIHQILVDPPKVNGLLCSTFYIHELYDVHVDNGQNE